MVIFHSYVKLPEGSRIGVGAKKVEIQVANCFFLVLVSKNGRNLKFNLERNMIDMDFAEQNMRFDFEIETMGWTSINYIKI